TSGSPTTTTRAGRCRSRARGPRPCRPFRCQGPGSTPSPSSRSTSWFAFVLSAPPLPPGRRRSTCTSASSQGTWWSESTARSRLPVRVLSRRPSMLVRSALARRSALMALALGAAFVHAADYETPPTFKASAILPAKQVKGPLFTVSETVKNDGFLNDFHITTPEFGDYDVQGKTMLLVRLQEIAALGELQKGSKSEGFLKSAGTSVVNVGKGVGKAVTDPGGTVKGVGAGVKRFGVNLGRKSKRAAESVTDDDDADKKDDKLTTQKTGEAAEGAAYSI